jgi:hypothetical protein
VLIQKVAIPAQRQAHFGKKRKVIRYSISGEMIQVSRDRAALLH